MFIIYDLIFVLFSILYFPYLVVRGKWHSGFKMRFGALEPEVQTMLGQRERIWIHAVSVGEVLAVSDLVRKIKEVFPHYDIICSTVTKTGNQLAQEQLGSSCAVIYAPLDFSWIVRKFVRIIDPKIYIATETEIWPNLYTTLHKKGVPIIQINGRISDGSWKGYKRVRWLTKCVLNCVDVFCMQSSMDADRIVQLGAAPERVRIVGNLKFDNIPITTEIHKKHLGFQEHDELFIAGSTHPGEEDILIDTFKTLNTEFLNLRLVIAPRHIERAGDVIGLIEQKGYHAVRFSDIKNSQHDGNSIIVVDTIGHLRNLYSLAKIVFIGKSLTVGGGQNVIESASLGKPTLVGPLMQNFKDVVNIFLKSNSLIQVNNSEELLSEAQGLLRDDERARTIGAAAAQTVKEYQGATSKTIDAIRELVGR